MNFDEWLKEEYGDSLLTNRMRLSLKDVWDYQQKKLDCCSEEIREALEALNDGEFNYCQSKLENILKGNEDD